MNTRQREAEAAADKAYFYDVNGNYEAAIAAYTTAIYSTNDCIQEAEYYSKRGFVYVRLKNFKSAIEDFTKVKRINGDQYKYHLNLALTYLVAKQYDECIVQSNAILTIKNDNIEALIHRGCAYFYKHQYNDSLKDFFLVIEINPDDPLYYFNAAMVYCALNDDKSALAFFKQARLLGANNFNFYYQYGNTLLYAGRYLEAISNLAIAITKKQELAPLIKLSIAYCYAASYEKANKYIKKAIELYPNSSSAYTTRAYLLYIQRNFAQAKNDLLRAVSIKKTNGTACLLLAIVLLKLNEIKEAENYLSLAANEDTKWDTNFFYKQYSEILLTRIQKQKHPEELLQNILTFLEGNKNYTPRVMNATCILTLGYHSAENPDKAIRYSMALLQRGSPIYLPIFLRNDWFDFITNENIACKKTISSTVRNVLPMKENWISCILQTENNILRQRMLWQALLPNTMIGCIFYIPRHGTPPSLSAGKLLEVLTLLNKENNLKMDKTFMTCLASLKNQPVKYDKFTSELAKITASKFPKLHQILIENVIIPPNITTNISAKNIKLARDETINSFNSL